MDRFVPRDDAKRQRGRSQERIQRNVFRVWERLPFTGLGGEEWPTWRGWFDGLTNRARYVRWVR